MKKQADPATVIKDRLAELNRSIKAAETIGGLGRNYIYDLVIGKKTDIRSSGLPKLAKALDWSLKDLYVHGIGDASSQAQQGSTLIEIDPAAFDSVPVDVPVFGIAAASAVGSFVVDGQIETVRRPPGLRNAKNIYGLYVHGMSMSPRFVPGDLIIVSPDRPPRAGDAVVIQTQNYPNADIQCWLKELIELTDDHALVRQLTPEGKIEFKREQVVAVHRVLTTRELFGL